MGAPRRAAAPGHRPPLPRLTTASDRARRRGWLAALALTLVRLALAPVFVAIAAARSAGAVAATLLVLGFLSDVFDGVVARRFGVATATLRRLDSSVDTIFYLAVAWAAWRIAPEPLRANRWGVVAVLATMALNYVVEWLRFRREASYHARSARLFGLVLFAALAWLLATGSGALIPAAVVCGLLSHAENLAITLVLPRWQHDVPSVVHAWRIRQAVLASDAA